MSTAHKSKGPLAGKWRCVAATHGACGAEDAACVCACRDAVFLVCGCLLTHLRSCALVCTHMHTSCMASRMAGSASRVEALRGPRNNVRSSGAGESRLGYGRVTESLDERALSSASTPVHNMPGAGKSAGMTAGRHAMGQVSYDAGDKLLTALPRRYSNAGTGSMAKGLPGGTNAYDRVSRLSGSKASPGARDENEAPNNGAPLSIFGVTLRCCCSRAPRGFPSYRVPKPLGPQPPHTTCCPRPTAATCCAVWGCAGTSVLNDWRALRFGEARSTAQ